MASLSSTPESTASYTFERESGEFDLTAQLASTVSPSKGCLAQESAQLVSAAAKGKIETIQKLLASKADVNACNEKGMTALYAAVMNRQIDAANELLKKPDISVNVTYKHTSPLMYAAHIGEVQMVQALLEKKADIRIKDRGNTAKILAQKQLTKLKPTDPAMQSFQKIINLLTTHKKNPNHLSVLRKAADKLDAKKEISSNSVQEGGEEEDIDNESKTTTTLDGMTYPSTQAEAGAGRGTTMQEANNTDVVTADSFFPTQTKGKADDDNRSIAATAGVEPYGAPRPGTGAGTGAGQGTAMQEANNTDVVTVDSFFPTQSEGKAHDDNRSIAATAGVEPYGAPQPGTGAGAGAGRGP